MGTAAKWLSILSNIPPCPGIRLEESFTPAILLKRLAVASPITEKIQTINMIITNGSNIGEDKKDIGIIIINGVRNIDISTPSRVLFGLMFGKNFLFPNFLPAKYAIESIRALILIKTIKERLVENVIPNACSGYNLLEKRINTTEDQKQIWISRPEINQKILC